MAKMEIYSLAKNELNIVINFQEKPNVNLTLDLGNCKKI